MTMSISCNITFSLFRLRPVLVPATPIITQMVRAISCVKQMIHLQLSLAIQFIVHEIIHP